MNAPLIAPDSDPFYKSVDFIVLQLNNGIIDDKTKQFIDKLAETLQTISRNRTKFTSISDKELIDRKKIVSDLQIKFNNKRHYNITATNVPAPAHAHMKEEQLMKKHADVIADQDKIVEKISDKLDILDRLAKETQSELSDQEKMLADIDNATDKAQSKLNHANTAITKILKVKNNMQLGIIAALTAIAVTVTAVAFS